MLILQAHFKCFHLGIVFEQQYWFLITVISLMVAAGITLLLYFRNKEVKDLGKWQKSLLLVLRFTAVFFLAFLFTNPLLKTLKKINELPLIVLAVDNSMSIKGLPEINDPTPEILKSVSAATSSLEKKYRLVRYTFGSETTTEKEIDFGEKISDYGQMLQTVYDNHFNENLGALVIYGDGNYNQGENPLNSVQKFHFPVYTIGTGDTAIVKDAAITSLRINKTVFKGNRFPVEADLKFSGLNNSRLQFSVAHQGKKVFSQVVEVNDPDFFTTIPMEFEAEGSGLQYYTAIIEPAPGEQNKLNNTWPFVIQVLDNKQKILILSAGVHPDIGAIKYTLESQVSYEVSVHSAEPYPSDLTGYSLVILHQLPSISQSGRQIVDLCKQKRIPLLILVGAETMLPQLKMLGLGVEVTPLAGLFEEVQVQFNDQFGAFLLEKEVKESMGQFPPLKVPFARFQLEPEYNVLAWQRVKNISTNKPLIAVSSKNGNKTGIIFGEGIWRWRIYDHLRSGNKPVFVEWLDKLIQYLALQDNEDNFIVDFQPVYRETESIRMSAEVYNEAYEPVSEAEVNMEITDSLNRRFFYAFDRINQFYRLDPGSFPPGKYHFRATAKAKAAEYEETGDFVVVPVNLEQIDLMANHRLLFQLSGETGGKYYELREATALIDDISTSREIRTTNYFQSALNELINQKWIFLVLLLLLSAEWFLRKFWGIY